MPHISGHFQNFQLTHGRIQAIWSSIVMAETNYLKCSCKECGNHIEYPESAAGTTIDCPHCGQWTELPLPEKPVKATTVNLGLVAVIIGIIAVVSLAVWFYISGPKSGDETAPISVVKAPTNPVVKAVAVPTNPPPPVVTQEVVEAVSPPRPKSHADLKVGKIELEKTPGSSLVYAVGTVKNDSAYQRFGVKVELDLFDKDGTKMDTTQDYKDIIEPHKEWRFHALIPEKKTVSAKLAKITEEE
jgi:hypothetical protein